MPIKLPKGFARRKSSSNALEEVQNPPQSSFRVFERPSGDKKSLSDGNLVAKRLSEGQPLDSPTEDDNNIFALHNSQPTRHQYETPLSSDEFLPLCPFPVRSGCADLEWWWKYIRRYIICATSHICTPFNRRATARIAVATHSKPLRYTNSSPIRCDSRSWSHILIRREILQDICAGTSASAIYTGPF